MLQNLCNTSDANTNLKPSCALSLSTQLILHNPVKQKKSNNITQNLISITTRTTSIITHTKIHEHTHKPSKNPENLEPNISFPHSHTNPDPTLLLIPPLLSQQRVLLLSDSTQRVRNCRKCQENLVVRVSSVGAVSIIKTKCTEII